MKYDALSETTIIIIKCYVYNVMKKFKGLSVRMVVYIVVIIELVNMVDNSSLHGYNVVSHQVTMVVI